MFDANAGYASVGKKFFATISSVNSKMKECGISSGNLVICEHIEKDNKRDNKLSLIWFNKTEKPIEYRESIEELDDFALICYEGNLDGTGFIDNSTKNKALEFLGGNWNQGINLEEY